MTLTAFALLLPLLAAGAPPSARATTSTTTTSSSSTTARPSPAPATPSPSPPPMLNPRPVADVRIQNRYASNAHATLLFAGVDYLERRDYYVSPGMRLGVAHFLTEALGIELQVSRYFSQLSGSAERLQQTYGVLPDSRAPQWLVVGGLRAALGYGKLMVSGLGTVVHFQPQILVQGGLHAFEGDVGPSGLAGLGLLVHGTSRFFVRLDGAVSLDMESRTTGTVAAIGFLPSLVAGGVL